MKKSLIIISLLLISITSCKTLDENVIPLDPYPEKPVLSGDAEEDATALIATDLRWRIWAEYARYHNGEITYKEYQEIVEPILSLLEDMNKAIGTPVNK